MDTSSVAWGMTMGPLFQEAIKTTPILWYHFGGLLITLSIMGLFLYLGLRSEKKQQQKRGGVN